VFATPDDQKDFVTGTPEGFVLNPIPAPASLSDDKRELDLAGTYAINDDVNVYARVATGFRGASVQPPGRLEVSRWPNPRRTPLTRSA